MRWINVPQDATDAGEAIVRAAMLGDGMSDEVAELIEKAVRDHDPADLVRGLANLSSTLVRVLAMSQERRSADLFEELVSTA